MMKQRNGAHLRLVTVSWEVSASRVPNLRIRSLAKKRYQALEREDIARCAKTSDSGYAGPCRVRSTAKRFTRVGIR
jgi:hypothetical protein